MKLNQTLIMNTQGNKLLLDKNGYLLREDFLGNRKYYGLSENGEGASNIVNLEILQLKNDTIEINAEKLEDLKSIYFIEISDELSILNFPTFDNLPETMQVGKTNTIELWVHNTSTISTLEFANAVVINEDNIKELQAEKTHVFVVRIAYIPNGVKTIAVNYAYSF